MLLLALIVACAAFASQLAPGDPAAPIGRANEGSSAHAWLGTDRLGRDIFSRTVHGARRALAVAGTATVFGAAAGLVAGAASGYAGGWIDHVIQRGNDAVLAFPPLVFLLLVSRYLGATPISLAVILGVLIAPGVARVVRAAALTERSQSYIEAARALGASEARVLFRHIIPALLPVALVLGGNVLGGAIIADASLAFLGLGVSADGLSWGADVASARAGFPVNTAAVLAPGVAIMATVLAVNLASTGRHPRR
ncbi:MAG: ABC transporter permease [Dehalococcoidia bacterium]